MASSKTTSGTLPASKEKEGAGHFLKTYGFILRFFLVSFLIGLLMQGYNVNIGAIGQGFALALVGVGVFITFRILQFPDLTVDGSFPVGGAMAAALIAAGNPAELTLFAAFFAGALTGLVTALIHIYFKIEGLLASIIVATGAYTIVLRIMGTSNIPLINERTILSSLTDTLRVLLEENFGREARRYASNISEIVIFSIVVVLVMLLLNWFLHTEIGLSLRAAGRNRQMVRAVGIDDRIMIILGLMVSNGLAGLGGALTVQQLGFADVQMGVGVIIRGLAAVMIGEVLLRPKSVGQMVLAAGYGMLVFEILRAWVFAALELEATDVRLISSVVVFIALAAPYIIEKWQERQRRVKLRQGSAE